MQNINIHRIRLMMRKYLLEIPMSFKITLLVCVVGSMILKIISNDKIVPIQIEGLYFGFLTTIGIMGGFGSLRRGYNFKLSSADKIGLLQIPASPLEKMLGLWASQFPFLLMVTGIVILGPETIFSKYLMIFRIEPVSFMGFATILVQMMLINSFFAISTITLKTVTDIKLLVYGIPNLFIVFFYFRIFSPLMKSGFQIPLLLIEVLISVGCWYIIYRRIAYAQIK
jgi:hypothetical protein